MSIFDPRAWRTPSGDVWRIYSDMASQPHLLVAGATGSGKSVVLRGVLSSVLHHSPARVGLILIDPKRVELRRYARLPHVLAYASEPDAMRDALVKAMDITDRRYKDMARRGLLKYDGGDVYVIIDELADLMTTDKRRCAPLIQRLAQVGRAARVHVIAATQCPLATVIPTPIKVNFDARVGLRTRSAQDSRNILSVTGCELLPRFGQGYYMTPEGLIRYKIPFVPDSEVDRLVSWWTSKACRA